MELFIIKTMNLALKLMRKTINFHINVIELKTNSAPKKIFLDIFMILFFNLLNNTIENLIKLQIKTNVSISIGQNSICPCLID